MAIIVCPGFHPPALTVHFRHQLESCFTQKQPTCCVFPAHEQPPWSAYALTAFLRNRGTALPGPLLFIAFSAGCVATVSAVNDLLRQGWPVAAIILVDGWGVPITPEVVGYRLSHDAITHATSAALGRGNASFYAEPSVSHHDLWQHPAQVVGHQMGFDATNLLRHSVVPKSGKTTALQFLQMCLHQHPDAVYAS